MNRLKAPEFYQSDNLDLIFPERLELHPGVTLFWFKEVKDDAVKLDIEWSAGKMYQDKALVAGFTNKLILAGTPTKSSKQIADEIDFYGGFVQHEIDKDQGGITLFGLSEHIGEIFGLFSTAFDEADFPQSEVEKERKIRKNGFRIESEKVKVRCHRKFNELIFGTESRYGGSTVEEDYDLLSREDLQTFFDQFYRSTPPTLFLTGNVSAALIDQLKKWTLQFADLSVPDVIPEVKTAVGPVHEDKPGAIQTAIRIGRLGISKRHPDYYAFQVMNTILGGYFGSRLMANIREDKGFTYGIGSGLAVMQHAAYFFISTEVGTDVKEDALKEIYSELERLQTKPVDSAELERVKNYMLGEFLRQADGPLAMMDCYKNIWYNDLSEDYYNDFMAAVRDVTPKRIMEIAQKYLNKEEMLQVTAG